MKKLICKISVFAVIVISAYNVYLVLNNKTTQDVAFSYIEALADDEGTQGTPLKTCYMDYYSWDSTKHLTCNTQTTENLIFPCTNEWIDGSGIDAKKCKTN